MNYEGQICRPPMERASYMLPVAVGCSYNACTFCTLFKHLQYRQLPKEQIEQEKKQAKELAEKLESLQVRIKASAGADGRFYGAVTSKEVAEQLAKQHGITVDRRKIQMDAIKACGSYTLEVRLYTEVTGKIHLLVTE